jgi:hypothetical protein
LAFFALTVVLVGADSGASSAQELPSTPRQGQVEASGLGLPAVEPLPPAPAALLPLAALPTLIIGTSFESSRLNVDSTFIPPDTMGAVGPDHIVEMINGNYQVFDKTGVSLDSRSLDSFWTSVAGLTIPGGQFTFDPRVVYDPASNRFFATSIDGGTPNNIYLARSDTSDPTGDWDGIRFAADTVTPNEFHDYDTLAVDADGLYICTNDFTSVTNDDSCYSIPKADLLLAAPSIANLTRFEATPAGLPAVTGSLQPSLDFGASDGRAALLGSTGTALVRTSILGAGGAGATLAAAVPITGDPGHAAAPAARQPHPNGRTIENVTPRLVGNVFEQGNSLWAVHSVQGTGANAAVRWYEIDETTNTVLQTGLIDDTTQDFHEPSIAVNSFGQVVIGYTCSGPTLAPASCVSAGETVAGVTTFDPPLVLQAGAGHYWRDFNDPPDAERNRWGDYSATVIDPADPCTFWTFQEYVAVSAVGDVGPSPLSEGGFWGVEATQLTFSSCPVINIVKTVDSEPDGVFDDDPSGWTFDVTNGVTRQATTDATGLLSFRVPPGLYSVTESEPPAGDTGLWLVGAECVDDATGDPLPGEVVDQLFGPTLTGVTIGALDLDLDESITCSFANQRMAGFVTGGGQIRNGRPNTGKRVSFAGNVGVAIDGSLHGQYQTHFHRVSNPNLSGKHIHGKVVESVLFGNDDPEEPPNPPDAQFNEVHFVVSGDLGAVPCQLSVDGTDHGEPAAGKNAGKDSDSIRLRLDCPGVTLDYDSWADFSEDEAVGLHHLDTGNLQIHPPE